MKRVHRGFAFSHETSCRVIELDIWSKLNLADKDVRKTEKADEVNIVLGLKAVDTSIFGGVGKVSDTLIYLRMESTITIL